MQSHEWSISRYVNVRSFKAKRLGVRNVEPTWLGSRRWSWPRRSTATAAARAKRGREGQGDTPEVWRASAAKQQDKGRRMDQVGRNSHRRAGKTGEINHRVVGRE